MGPLNIEKDIMYHFNEKEYKKWRSELSDRLTLNPNPNGFYINAKGIKCDQRDVISHEFNRYCSFILNYGTMYEKEHNIKYLIKIVKAFDALGEIQIIKTIITAPDKDWNLVNRVVGLCNVLFMNNLCTKECTNNEIREEDI